MKIEDLKVGDKLLLSNFDAHDDDVTEEMRHYLGTIVTVSFISIKNNRIYIVEDGEEHYYYLSWFSLVDEKSRKKFLKSSKSIPARKKELRKRLLAKAGQGVSNYGYLVKNQNSLSLSIHANDICHARLRHNLEVVAVLDVIGGRKGRFSDDEYKSFLRYAKFVMTKSASRGAFKYTNMNSYVKHGVWMNVEVTSSHLMSAITFLRMGSEYKCKLALIDKLVKDGIPYGVAAILGMCFRRENGSDKYTTNLGDNHSAFSSHASLHLLRKWADGDVSIYNAGKPYRTRGADWKVHLVLSSVNQPKLYDFLNEVLIKTNGAQDVWGVKRAKPGGYEGILEVAKEFLKITDKVKE